MADISGLGYAGSFLTPLVEALTKAYQNREARKAEQSEKQKEYKQQIDLMLGKQASEGVKEGTLATSYDILRPLKISEIPTEYDKPVGYEEPISYAKIGDKELPLTPSKLITAKKALEKETLYGIPAIGKALEEEQPYKSIQLEKGKKLPEGFTQITNPETKAKLYNETFGTNYTTDDFKQQVAPIVRMITDANGKIRFFTREGEEINKDKSVYGNIPSQIKTTIAGLDTNLGNISELRDFYNKTGAKDVGIIQGRAKKIGTRFYNDKDAQELINRNAQLLAVVYDLSGKAINQNEMDWLKKEILPDIAQPSENYEVSLNLLENWLSKKKGMLRQQYPGLEATDNISNNIMDISEDDIQETMRVNKLSREEVLNLIKKNMRK